MVNGDRVRQARELKSITQKRLAELASISQAAVGKLKAVSAALHETPLASLQGTPLNHFRSSLRRAHQNFPSGRCSFARTVL